MKEVKRLFDNVDYFYTSVAMLANINNEEVVKNLVNWSNNGYCFFRKTINVLDDDISNLSKYDLVKVTISIDDTKVSINYSKATKLSELANSYCIVSKINSAIAAFIMKSLYKVSINGNFYRDTFAYSKFYVIEQSNKVAKSPITLNIPNKEELDTLRSMPYQQRVDAGFAVHIPLPNYLQENAIEVVSTEDAGHLIIASNVEDATIIED